MDVIMIHYGNTSFHIALAALEHRNLSTLHRAILKLNIAYNIAITAAHTEYYIVTGFHPLTNSALAHM